ncbi:MAG: hypothetical protein RLZZ627_2055 [Pseudomonadota bacterium]|jgi:hypothetical protein
MAWLKRLFGFGHGTSDTETLDRYRAARAMGRDLQVRMIKELPKPALPECAKKLGLVKSGTLIINQDDEIAIAYDYCLHHFRRAGKNVIERTLENTSDEQEMAWLNALTTARFSVFMVESITPHRGARLVDLIHEESIDLIDLGLASTGQAGLILLGRIVTFDGFHLSSGTLIPIPPGVLESQIRPVFEKFERAQSDRSAPLSSSQSAALEAQATRIALHEAGEDNSFFSDIES